MRKILVLAAFGLFLAALSCKDDTTSERFGFLTGTVWTSDSLLVNNTDASGSGGLLEKFKGDAEFRADGTGYFGIYTGSWKFSSGETEITIFSDSLSFPLTSVIDELTAASFKISTAFPNQVNPDEPLSIRMTFKAK